MTTPSLDERIRGMILGQFVGDAAALGTHWIYDLGEMAAAYPGGIHGFEPPREGHYHFGKHPGDQTHYGDAALLLLESVASCGRYEAADFAKRFIAFFGNQGIVTYRDHSTKDTLKHLAQDSGNLVNGATSDDQPATVSRLASVVAIHREDLSIVESLTRFSQNNDRAVAYARADAQILNSLLNGSSFPAALNSVNDVEPAEKIAAAHAAQDKTVVEATMSFGQGCPLPKTFPAAVHAALKHGSDFRETVLETTRAGGDSAGRASMVGAWLGAALGIRGIPADWPQKLTAGARIETAVEKILAAARAA